jgi:hypothetical protein
MSARAKKAVRAVASQVQTPGGATASVEGDRLVLRNTRGAVVVVYDAERGSTEITASAGDLTLSAPQGRIALSASEIVLDTGRFELRAGHIVERVGDVYREIEGLLQTRAQRVRTLVRGAYQLLAKRTEVVAEEDVAVDGKRVLLG